MKRIALLALLATFAATTLIAEANAPTTVILVRHAEKASADEDPPLSTAGAERARELARVLTGVKVDVIYTTQYRRTNETAAPTAAMLGLTPVVRKTGESYAADLARHLTTNHAGQTVLVVGHSNSTINVMKALGVTGLPTMPESEYDNLFIVTLVDGAKPVVVPLRFGAVAR
jgi:broad specificity phosphatase PhoE